MASPSHPRGWFWGSSPLAFWGDKLRERLFQPLLRALAWAGMTPDRVSVSAVVLHFPAAYCVAIGALVPAAILLAIAGILDALDGELARHLDQASTRGGFLDSICDHVNNFILGLGLVVYVYPSGPAAVCLVLASFAGSAISSLVRARAGAHGVDCRVGLVQRTEYLLILILGLCLGLVLPAVAVVAVLNTYSAAERFRHVWRHWPGLGRDAPVSSVARF